MTRDSAIDKQSKLYAKNREKCGLIDPITLDEIECAFYSGGIWADEHPHWISVEDETPIDYETVLAAVGRNHFAFVGFCLNKKTWYCEIQNKAIEIEGITHWMPLPQPPSSLEILNNYEKGGNK